MKKFQGKIIALVLLVCSAFAFTACGSLPEFKFTANTIEIELGQEYDIYDYVAVNKLSDEQKQDLKFRTAHTNIAVVFEDKLIASHSGSTVLTAYYQDTALASANINVKAQAIPLDCPTGLTYDNDTNLLRWNYSSYEIEGVKHSIKDYKLEINRNGDTSYRTLNDENTFAINASGAYSIKISALAPTANADAFTVSESVKSPAYEFNLLSKPQNLEYDFFGHKLMWTQGDQNFKAEKFLVKYEVNSKEYSDETDQLYYTIPTENLEEGTFVFQVIPQVPDNPGETIWFVNQSDSLEVKKLAKVADLTFNNGEVSFTPIVGATKYTLTIKKDGDTSFTKTITLENKSGAKKITTSEIKKYCTTQGDYTLSVVAEGDGKKIASSDATTEFTFTKLPDAKVTFNKSTRTFTLENNGSGLNAIGEGSLNLFIANKSEPIDSDEHYIVWDGTSSLNYSISGQILTVEPDHEIDGNVISTFSIKGDTSDVQLKYVKNLKSVSLQYEESADGKAIISLTEIDAGCDYDLLRSDGNNEVPVTCSTSSSAGEHNFNLGTIATAFEGIETHGNQFDYVVKISKPSDATTYYFDTSSKITIKKLVAPTKLTVVKSETSSAIRLSVVDAVPTGATEAEFLVNGVVAQRLENLDLESWNIKAQFKASTVCYMENNNPLYYTSSSYTAFTINRLPQMSVSYDYNQTAFVTKRIATAETYTYRSTENASDITTTTNTIQVHTTASGIYNAVANPAEFGEITSGVVGLLPSLPVEVEVISVLNIPEIPLLTKQANGAITATWFAPESYEKTLNYIVQCKGINAEKFENVSAKISKTSYDFEPTFFDAVGDYTIRILVVNPDGDNLLFFAPNAELAPTVTVTRLAPMTQLVLSHPDEITYQLSTSEVDSNIMTGLSSVGVLTKVNAQTENFDLSTFDTSFSQNISIDNGETLTITSKFVGWFSQVEGVYASNYYLDSAEKTFTIKKLNKVKDLNLISISQNAITSQTNYNFQWTAGDIENGSIANYVKFQYYYDAQEVEQIVYDNVLVNQKTISRNSANATDVTFYVKEVPLNQINEINAGGLVYIECDEFVSYTVVQEKAVTDIEFAIFEGQVYVSWCYEPAYEQSDKYAPTISCNFIRPNGTSSSNTVRGFTDEKDSQTEGNEYRQKQGKFYSVSYPITQFKEMVEGRNYVVSMTVTSRSTLPSPEKHITIEKLDKVEYISIVDEGMSYANAVNQLGEPISLQTGGIKGLSVTSSQGNNISVAGTQIDLSNISYDSTCNLTIYKQAILPSETESSYMHYYIDGDPTTFSIVKLMPTKPDGDMINKILSWQTRNTETYELHLYGANHDETITIVDYATEYSLEDITDRLSFEEPGLFYITVRAIAVNEPVLNSQTTGYLSSNFGEAFQIAKLPYVDDLTLTSNEDQSAVSLSWTALQGATHYTINLSTPQLTLKKVELEYAINPENPTISIDLMDIFQDSALFDAVGTYRITVKASSADAIESVTPENLAVTIQRLAQINNLAVNSKSVASWRLQYQLSPSDFETYQIEVFDSNSVSKFVINKNSQGQNLKDTYYDLFDNADLKQYIQSLNGESFKIQVSLIGTIPQSAPQVHQRAVTLNSFVSDQLEIYKLQTPVLAIEGNSIVIKNNDIENVEYKVTVNGSIITLSASDAHIINPNSPASSYEIEAYATFSNGTTIIDSEKITETHNVLATPINIVATELSGERDQTEVRITWNAVEGAETYSVLINDEEFYSTSSTTYDAPESLFKPAGQYVIKIRALSNSKLDSKLSAPLTIVRLAQMEGTYLSADKVVHFGEVFQLSQEYSYYITLCNGDNEVVKFDTLDNTQSTYEDFADEITAFDSGRFFITLQAIGNGSSTTTSAPNLMTLSSKTFEFDCLKLFKPTITVGASQMTIETTNGEDNNTPSGVAIQDISTDYYSIFFNDAYATVNNINSETTFVYPDEWLAGTYTIKAVSKPDENVQNVVESNELEISTIRLDAPTELAFYRSALSESSTYCSDENTSPSFVNDLLHFVFTGVDHANSYKLYNATTQYETDKNITDLEFSTEFSKLVYSGDEYIQVMAISAGGGDYINSAPTKISYSTLGKIENFRTSGGRATWKAQSQATAYLVSASKNNSTVYWQSENGQTTSSALTGIMEGFEGVMTVNIKSIGNVSTTSKSTEILLDSEYLTNAISVLKLKKITNLSAKNGLISFSKIPDARSYYITVYTTTYNDELGEYVPATPYDSGYLDNYSDILDIQEYDNSYIGYSSLLENLPTDQVFALNVQARSDLELVIYSDKSNFITAKVLGKVNNGAELKLSNAPNEDLTKKQIVMAVNPNSSGVWIKQDSLMKSEVFEINEDGEIQVPTEFAHIPAILQSEPYKVSFASMGSSMICDEGYYYLTSLFTNFEIPVLDEPNLYVVSGNLSWDEVTNASGYYVYISKNGQDPVMYYEGVYEETSIDLPTTFADEDDVSITLGVIAVTSKDDFEYLCSPMVTLQLIQDVNGVIYKNDQFVVKLQKPDNFEVKDGSLVWADGIKGLEDYDEGTLKNIFNQIKLQPTKTNLDRLDTYIANMFTTPITTYSKYSGFNSLQLQLTMRDSAGVTYSFAIDAYKFISLTNEQTENLQSLIALLSSSLEETMYYLGESTNERLYTLDKQTYLSDKQYAYARLDVIAKQVADASGTLANILATQGNPGCPGINTLFEEINTQTAGMLSGEYILTIQQKGNDFDWLHSGISDEQKVYIPYAPSNLEITMHGNDFYLEWDKVNIPSSYNYSAILKYADDPAENEISTDVVYVLYGDDASGVHHELLRTNGMGSADNEKLSLSLTDLIESGILTTDINQIFLVVLGQEFVEPFTVSTTPSDDPEGEPSYSKTTNIQVLTGKKSVVLPITVLPQVELKMNFGELEFTNAIGSNGVEIACDSFESINWLEATWLGTNLSAGENYDLGIRLIGSIVAEGEQTSYTLTGKTFNVTIGKLAIPNVKVNEFGIFDWADIEHASGYVDFVNDVQENEVLLNSVYEAKVMETIYNNYKFFALGDTKTITEGDTVYYLNSAINNSELGIDGCILSAIDSFEIRKGLIAWKPLATTQNQNVPIPQSDDYKKNVDYRLTFNDGQTFFTNELNSSVFGKDGDFLTFDFSEFGMANPNYQVTIQAFINFASSSTDEVIVGTNLYEGKVYAQLLGVPFVGNFEMIPAPTNIQINNGELIWNGNENDTAYYYEIYLGNSQTPTKGQVDQTSYWPEEAQVGYDYTFRVKAYEEGKVFSNFTSFKDKQDHKLFFSKIAFEISDFNLEQQVDGNYVTFSWPHQDQAKGINIKYILNGETKMFKVDDPDYSRIVSTTNEVMTINISGLVEGATYMVFALQLVPLGETLNISSDFTDEYTYSTPEPIQQVLFDEEKQEYYFYKLTAQDEIINDGFIIQDMIYDSDDNLLATYYYGVPKGDLTGKNYYDSDTHKISFAPSIVGYKHIIAVAVSADPSALIDPTVETPLMSSYITCDTPCIFNLFETKENIFAEDSALWKLTSSSMKIAYLKEHAYGSANNPYLVPDVATFENINKRLVKYEYQNSYIVSLANETELLNVTDLLVQYTFNQTEDLIGITSPIGQSNNGITLIGFDNIYDGLFEDVVRSISYSIDFAQEFEEEQQVGNFGLFRQIDTHGIVKNLKISATFDCATLANIIPTIGGVTAKNYGLIEKVDIVNISVINTVKDNVGLLAITFGGITAENYGTIKNVSNVTEHELAINTIEQRDNKVLAYVGGLVGKNWPNATIRSAENKMPISLKVGYTGYVAGIVAYNNGTVFKCISSASVNAFGVFTNTTTYVGGVVGNNEIDGSIEACIALKTCVITVENNYNYVFVGGIVGYSSNYKIKNCYSAVETIAIQKDIMGTITQYGGSLVGELIGSPITDNVNYYVNIEPFMNNAIHDDFAKQLTQNFTVQNMILAINANYASQVFRLQNGTITIVFDV